MRDKFISSTKKMVKKVLKWDRQIVTGNYSFDKLPKSILRVAESNSEILNSRDGIGRRADNKEFYPEIKKIDEAFRYFRIKAYEFEDDSVLDINEYDGLHSGTPMRTKPFKPCIKEVRKSLTDKYLYHYPSTTGNIYSKQSILDYLLREGFVSTSNEVYDGLSVDNIVFTMSTTHAYSMILNLITRPEDVVLMPGPNYGLFAVEPERLNARVEIIDLKEEDEWFVNPEDLNKRIIEINKRLAKEFKGKLNYVPCVAAYLNMNPHNPIGNVMNVDNRRILEGIADVCLENDVIVIDDLIYRDLTFNQEKLALPMATMPQYFNNTISLFGLSKAYGLAGFRAGFIVAPIPICKGIASRIFQAMDSVPVLQVQSLVGAFNGSDKRYRENQKYFEPIINEYMYRFLLYKALVEGIDSIKNNDIKQRIIKDVCYYESDKKTRKILLDGIPHVEIRKKTTPTSGFFSILDFTKLKGMKYENEVIEDDFSLFKYLFSKGKIRYIMGSSMSWPIASEMVGRVNFAIEKRALINNMKIINLLVRGLK